MTIPGQTILTGATAECCGQRLEFEVLQSAAGYYIGTACPNCGPYSRESRYFSSESQADAALSLWRQGDMVGARIPEDQRLRAQGAATLPGLVKPASWPGLEGE